MERPDIPLFYKAVHHSQKWKGKMFSWAEPYAKNYRTSVQVTTYKKTNYWW
jgi:hypothetical protein